MGIGCATGLLYAIILYGFIGLEMYLGGGIGLFISLAYYVIEFHWLIESKETEINQFVKGILAIFVLLLMNDISMALEDYGAISDVPVSLGIIPYTLLFAFFAAFLFQARKMWPGKK